MNRAAVPYSEIVDDVFKKLNGKDANKKGVEQKEREIALGLFGPGWRDLPPKERHDRSKSVKVLSGTFSIMDTQTEAVGGATARLAAIGGAALGVASLGARLNPAGALASAGAGLHTLAAEASRITVPFVAQMGWIRLRKEADADKRPASLAPSSASSAQSAPIQDDFVLKTEQGGTLMKISLFESAPAVQGQPLSKEHISAFGPLLSNVPHLAAGAELYRGNYVVCSLPFDSLVDAADVDGAKRAWVSVGGRIKEQAHLSKPEELQNILLGGAMWNIVSTAVGQKHLHDISEKLTAIKRQLDEIQRHLWNEPRQQLEALVKYVQSLLDHYPQEGISSAAVIHLESRLVDMDKLEAHFRDNLSAELEKAKAVEAGKLFSADASRNALEESLMRMIGWARGYLQAVQLRVVSFALLYLDDSLERYRANAARSLDELKWLPDFAAKCRQVFGAQMELTNSMLSSIDELRKRNLVSSLTVLESDLKAGPLNAKQLHRTFFQRGDTKVLLRVENGRFTSGQLLHSADVGA